MAHQPAQQFGCLKVQNPPVVSAALVVAFAEQGQVQTAESAGSWQKMAVKSGEVSETKHKRLTR